MELFDSGQANFLIRLLLAHIISDFVLQTNKMVKTKKWFSGYMFVHIAIVFVMTLLLSGQLICSLLIAISHWLIDSTKCGLQEKYPRRQKELFIADQLMHVIIILIVWIAHFNLWHLIGNSISMPFMDYHFSLLLLAYVWLIFPVSFLIKFVTQSITPNTTQTNPKNELSQDNTVNIEHGGKLIGQFERIIILTLVLLNQYEAIGFLITGKSIIRFADHNSNLRSEYVLVGTMMSYAIAILTGVYVNYLMGV